MKTPNFLNVFNISKALSMLESGRSYEEINDDHVLVVAWDRTVWACMDKGSDSNLRDGLRTIFMVQRIV